MLSNKTLAELKAIAVNEFGLTPDRVREHGVLTKKSTWVSAIEKAQMKARELPVEGESLATVASQKQGVEILPDQIQALVIEGDNIAVRLTSNQLIPIEKFDFKSSPACCSLDPQTEYRIWSWQNQCCHLATYTLVEWRSRQEDFFALSLGTEVCLFMVKNDSEDLPTDSWQVEMDIRKAIHEKGFADGAAGLPMAIHNHPSYHAGYGRGWRDFQWKVPAPASVSISDEIHEDEEIPAPGTWKHTSEVRLLEKVWPSCSEETEAPTKTILIKIDESRLKAPKTNPKFHFGQQVCALDNPSMTGFIQSIHVKTDVYTGLSVWEYTVNSFLSEFGYYKFDGSFLWKESELAIINQSKNLSPHLESESPDKVFNSEGTLVSISVLSKDVNLMIKDLKMFGYIPVSQKGTASDPTPWIEVFWIDKGSTKKRKLGEIYWRGACWNASEELEEFMGDFTAFALQASIPEERLL